MGENRHRLVIDDRSALMMSGVADVVGFDDNRIELCGTFGGIDVLGEGLKISSLNLDEGKVSISGRIDAVAYGENREDKKIKAKGKKVLSRLLK